jgi:hypothetical protein
MKRQNNCGCKHKAQERKGNMPRKTKQPAKKMIGKTVAKAKAGQVGAPSAPKG